MRRQKAAPSQGRPINPRVLFQEGGKETPSSNNEGSSDSSATSASSTGNRGPPLKGVLKVRAVRPPPSKVLGQRSSVDNGGIINEKSSKRKRVMFSPDTNFDNSELCLGKSEAGGAGKSDVDQRAHKERRCVIEDTSVASARLSRETSEEFAARKCVCLCDHTAGTNLLFILLEKKV